MINFLKIEYYHMRYRVLYKYLMFNFKMIKKYNLVLPEKRKQNLSKKLEKAYLFSKKVLSLLEN